MPSRRRLLVGPAVPNQATLASLIARLGHYLAHVDVESIVIAVTPELARSGPGHIVSDPDLPTGIDPDVFQRVAAVSPKIALRAFGSPMPATPAEFLLLWDIRAKSTEPWRSLTRKYRQNRTLFDIDWQRTRADGSWFGELAMVLSKDSRAFDRLESDRFRARTENLMQSPTAFLVATGPSARGALDVDMSDGVRIACNTTILDDELMDHVRPQIVTFADPVFHFGPSTYAHQFQRALGRLALRQDFTVVTLERYAALLRDRLPQLADRIVGVRLGLPTWPQNYDLMSELAVKSYPNILTMLMLPLAATFSRAIELFGFDGRNPQESYFWRHGTTVQFDEELADIKLVHPGFFELDYEDYYAQHVVAVEQMFLDVELRGGRITPRTPSFMLPLRRRSPTSRRAADVTRRRSMSDAIVSITPDWTGDFGHFGPWERAVGTAARARGFDYYSLAGRALEPPNGSVLPTFARGSAGRECASPEEFSRELNEALTIIADETPTILCCYVADVWHLPTLLAIAAERPKLTVVVNLMRAHIAVADAKKSSDSSSNIPVQLLAYCLATAEGSSVHVCVDTAAAIDDVEALTGFRLLEWPMAMVGDRRLLEQAATYSPGGSTRLVAPVQTQMVKGFEELAELAERLSDSLCTGQVSLVARYSAQPGGMSQRLGLLAERFRRAGGELITHQLSDAQYSELVGSADVVLLPYRLETFRTRTSGVVLDAIAAGKPVIATHGTWAGELVNRTGVGATFEDGDVNDLEAAIQRVGSDLDRYHHHVAHVRDRLLTQFSPEHVVSFLAGLAAARCPPPAQVHVSWLQRCARLASHAQWKSAISRDQERLQHLVRMDDLQRSRDGGADQLELQRSINAWQQKEIDKLKHVESPLGPATSGRQRPAVSTDLHLNVYDRSANAHLDELALLAELVVPERLPKAVMVDVGAHHGSAFRRFRTAGWMIHAFEPDPRHFAYLDERYSVDDNIVLDNRAVSNASGEKVEFFISEESTGISGLSAFRESHVSIGEVETVALRDIPGLDRVDLLKIDTEGYEKFVLEGFPWERLMPAIVVAEFEDAKTQLLGYTTTFLIDYLQGFGYDVWVSEWHPIVRYGIQHQWRRLVSSDGFVPDSTAWGNLMAFREPVDPRELGCALAKVVALGDVR